MPRTSHHPKEETFNFRVDPALKAESQATAEAHRQSGAIAARAAEPKTDEAAVMHELDANLAVLADDWK